MVDPYINGKVLRNKLGITAPSELERAEANITFAKLLTIDQIVKPDTIWNFQQLQAVHRHIFGDVYAWAGEPRSIPIYKSEHVLGGDTVYYAAPTEIIDRVAKVLEQMEHADFTNLFLEKRSLEFSRFLAALWKIHPFREGNTRTTITFMCQYGDAHAMPIDRSLLQQNPGFVRNALVLASDGEPYANLQFIHKIIKEAMLKGFINTRLQPIEETRKMLSAAHLSADKDIIKKVRYLQCIACRNLSVSDILKLNHNPEAAMDQSERALLKNVVHLFQKPSIQPEP